jgi:hypothetical protein
MRKGIASTLQVIGKTAGILAAVAWGWTCWHLLAEQDATTTTSLEVRWGFRLLDVAIVSIPIVGYLVYCPFAALADGTAPSERRDSNG